MRLKCLLRREIGSAPAQHGNEFAAFRREALSDIKVDHVQHAQFESDQLKARRRKVPGMKIDIGGLIAFAVAIERPLRIRQTGQEGEFGGWVLTPRVLTVISTP